MNSGIGSSCQGRARAAQAVVNVEGDAVFAQQALRLQAAALQPVPAEMVELPRQRLPVRQQVPFAGKHFVIGFELGRVELGERPGDRVIGGWHG